MKENKWISIKEHMPHPYKRVIAFAPLCEKTVQEAFVDSCGNWHSEGNVFRVLSVVTHWMLLPEPPKMED